jgi:hypothetical protein
VSVVALAFVVLSGAAALAQDNTFPRFLGQDYVIQSFVGGGQIHIRTASADFVCNVLPSVSVISFDGCVPILSQTQIDEAVERQAAKVVAEHLRAMGPEDATNAFEAALKASTGCEFTVGKKWALAKGAAEQSAQVELLSKFAEVYDFHPSLTAYIAPELDDVIRASMTELMKAGKVALLDGETRVKLRSCS